METSGTEVREIQVEDSLDARLEGSFFGRGIRKISSRFRAMYNNNARCIKGASGAVLISAASIIVYNNISGSYRQATLTGPAYASSSSSSGRQDLLPSPTYDSGWVSVSQGLSLTLRHNLGGNVDNYVVDMQLRKLREVTHGWGTTEVTDSERHNMGIGGDYESDGGAWWTNLNPESIKLIRGMKDPHADQVRIRIWKY